MLKKIWADRLFGNQRSVDTWQDIMAVRTLVLTPKEDMKNWLKFASLCRRTGNKKQSHFLKVKVDQIWREKF